MPVTAGPAYSAQSICALDGCDTPVVRSTAGGRPRLYCSDAHRAQARRQRLRTGGDTGRAAAEGLAAAAGLLEEVLATVQRAAVPAPRADPLLAAERAQATATLLEAQRAAAEAAGQAAASERRLGEERSAWEAARAELLDARDQDAVTMAELRAALDGAQEALRDELLRHDADITAAEERLRALAAEETARRRHLADELERLRTAQGVATGRAQAAEARAARAEQETAAARRSVVEASAQVAEAEAVARHAHARSVELEAALRLSRTEASVERRRQELARRALESELFRSSRLGRAHPTGRHRAGRPTS